MAKDIEPAKRGDLVGHLSGERVECVAPIVRFLETSGQIPPVESGRSLAERPDTARIDRPAQQDTEIAPHPVAAEASRRPTQKQPPAPVPEHPTKAISADAPAFPQRPTDSLFMDPVVMTDDSFFDDGNLQAETPTLIEPSPAAATSATPPSASATADASDTVFDATLQPAPTLEGQDLSLETDLPSFSDDTGPPPEKGTDRVDKQPVEKPTTRVELRTDTKPPTTRRPDEVVRDTVNYYNQTTSLKDLLGSVVPQDTDTLNAGLPKEPLAPAVVAGGDFLNSDSLAPALPDDDDTDLSPTQTDARGPVTERIAAAPAPDIAPATDDAFETVGFDSADATRIDSALDFSEPPHPPAKPAATPTPVAAAHAPLPSADLPMPDSVGGDFLSNDELPSAAGDRIIPELMMSGATTESAPAAPAKPAAPPPPPAVATKPAAPKPFVPAADFETVALNGRTVALPPPPSTPTTTVRKVSPGRMPVVVPAKAATPPAAPPPAPKPAAATLPDAKTELGLSTQALAAASKTPPPAPVRPPLGQREAVRPSTPAPSTPSVAPAAAKTPAPSPAVPLPVAAKASPVAAKGPPPAVVAPAPTPVAAKGPPPAVVAPAPAPVAAKSLPPVAAAIPAASSSGETTIIVEPAAIAAHAKAVAAVAAVAAKPPTAPVRRPRPDHADTRRLIEKAEAVLAKLKSTSFIAPRRIAREETGRRAAPPRTVEVAPREAVSVNSAEVPATAQARLVPQSGSVPLDELLLGSSPPRDTGSSSGFTPLGSGFDSPRRPSRRDPPPRDELPGNDMDIGELLAAASTHGESTVSRRRARKIPADDPPPPREEPPSHKMTSVLAKELDGMLRQMAENTMRENRSSSALPAVPVRDKIAPAGVGETYLDGPLWWTLLGIAGISAFLTALFILIWFLLSKGGM